MQFKYQYMAYDGRPMIAGHSTYDCVHNIYCEAAIAR